MLSTPEYGRSRIFIDEVLVLDIDTYVGVFYYRSLKDGDSIDTKASASLSRVTLGEKPELEVGDILLLEEVDGKANFRVA